MMQILPKTSWFDFLSERIPHQLPGEKTHFEMSPLRQLSSEALRSAKDVKESAVAIHLVENKNELDIILTQRNTYKGAHSGQVSFPGGKKETNDIDLIHTARRESFEEVNIKVSDGLLIGKMTDIYIPVSGFKVEPFVFHHLGTIHDLKPDPREVKSIFKLPTSVLIQDEIVQTLDIQISTDFTLRDVPCFYYNDYIIWGATAILLNELKHILRDNY